MPPQYPSLAMDDPHASLRPGSGPPIGFISLELSGGAT
jgi:hypothetical protein